MRMFLLLLMLLCLVPATSLSADVILTFIYTVIGSLIATVIFVRLYFGE